MASITIEITPSEKTRLLTYCEGVHDSGHWGDGAVELPDEKILADRIRSADAVLELSLRDVDILVIHIEDSTDHGFMLLPEDQSLLLKLVEALEDGLRSELSLVERLEDTLRSVTAIIPENRHRRAVKMETSFDVPPAVTETPVAAPPPAATGISAETARKAERPAEKILPAHAHKDVTTGKPSLFTGLRTTLSHFFSTIAHRDDEAPHINQDFGISLDERIRRAKAAAKRINRNR